jgi:hypothetical protein
MFESAGLGNLLAIQSGHCAEHFIPVTLGINSGAIL